MAIDHGDIVHDDSWNVFKTHYTPETIDASYILSHLISTQFYEVGYSGGN